jgi:prepilin-type N-terminal cleavage/methylation domain-containing protein
MKDMKVIMSYVRKTSVLSGLCSVSRRFCSGVPGGFTIVELLIVVVIIAIAAAMAVPLMSSAGSLQVKSAANMIASDLEYAKSMAISRGRRYSVVFDEDAESYQIEDENGDVIAHPVRKGFDYVVDFSARGLGKVNIVSASFDSTVEVKFDFLGSPYDGDGGPLNSGVVSLSAGSSTATIVVEPVTGFITVNY